MKASQTDHLQGTLDLRAAEADLVVIFGGDGSILAAARRMGDRPIPTLGVNFGKFGFLADIRARDVTDELGAGELGGLLRVRDTILPAAIRSLDTIAYNAHATVNGVHNLGVGLDGTTGDFFAAQPGVEDAARDLSPGTGPETGLDRCQPAQPDPQQADRTGGSQEAIHRSCRTGGDTIDILGHGRGRHLPRYRHVLVITSRQCPHSRDGPLRRI